MNNLKRKARGNTGFSTLELLIAFSIFILVIGGITIVTFGNQTTVLDAELSNQAILMARLGLVTTTSADWTQANSFATTSDIYEQNISVTDISECVKYASSTVTWQTPGRPLLKTELFTVLTSTTTLTYLGGDCDTALPNANWKNPLEQHTLDIDKATGIDVNNHLAFITLKKTPSASDDLAIVDVTSSVSPILLSHMDVGNEPGFNAIDVATSTNGHSYAYIASNDPAKQLIVMDVTYPTNPIFVTSRLLPGITTGVGRSIFYYDKKVYIGTSYFVCSGCNELHIFDVSDPTSPSWITSINVNRNVNAISVRNGLAYIATGPGTSPLYNPLKIFDVNPYSSTYKEQVGSFTATGNEEGTAIYLLGNKLYLGLERAASGRPDFYVLDVTEPSSIITLASKNLSLNSSTKVAGIRVAENFGFISTSDPNKNLTVLDISKTTLNLINNLNLSQTTTGIDLRDNTIYLSSYIGSQSLEIIKPTP